MRGIENRPLRNTGDRSYRYARIVISILGLMHVPACVHNKLRGEVAVG
jgi:hypothetical protein